MGKKDGTIAVVIDIVPQVEKKIAPDKVHKQLRLVDNEDAEHHAVASSDFDSQSRSFSVARNCFDECNASEVESETLESEASWPMSVRDKRARARKMDKRILALDRRQLEGEVKDLRTEVQRLEASATKGKSNR